MENAEKGSDKDIPPVVATTAPVAEAGAMLPSLLPIGASLPTEGSGTGPPPEEPPSQPEQKAAVSSQPSEEAKSPSVPPPKDPETARKHRTRDKKKGGDEAGMDSSRRHRERDKKREGSSRHLLGSPVSGGSMVSVENPLTRPNLLPPLQPKPGGTLTSLSTEGSGLSPSLTGRISLQGSYVGPTSPDIARQRLALQPREDSEVSESDDESLSVSESGRSSRSVSTTIISASNSTRATSSKPASVTSVGGTFGEEHRARFVSGKGSQMPAAPPPRRPIKPQTQWEKLQERFLDAWYKHVLRKERPKKTYRHRHHHKHHRCIKLSPREKQGLAFIFSELLLIAAFLLQLGTFRSWLFHMEEVQVSGEVGLLDLTFSLRQMHMSNGFKGQSTNPAIVSLLTSGGGTQAERAAVKTILAGEVTGREIEFASLLTAEGKILVSANNNRTGEVWDVAGGLAARVSSGAATQIRSTDLISYTELIREGPPLIRSRFLDTQMTSFNHLYDTRDTGLINYVVTSVKDGSGTPVGALVSGDLADGKTLTPFLAVRGLESGYAAVYHRSMTKDGYMRACSYASTKLALGPTTQTSELDPVPQALLRRAENDPSGSVVTATTPHFTLAAKRIQNGMVDGVIDPNDRTPGVIVRGLAGVDSSLFDSIYSQCSIYLAVVILVNLLALYVSLTTFVMPLERLASKLKHNPGGTKVDLSDLKSQRMTTSYVIRVAVTTVVALAMCVVMYEEVAGGLRDFLKNKATSALGVSRVAWDVKVDQMGLGFRGLSTNTYVRELLDEQNSTTLINATSKALQGQQTLRKIEYTLLLNSSLHIIATGDPESPLLGSRYDPARGIASAALATGLRYKRTAVVPYSDVMSEPSRPVFVEKLNPTTADSKLFVGQTKGYALVRFTSTPVRSASSALTDKPDGVLISGEILNGKTVMVERALKILGLGYAAVYLKNPDGSGYTPVTSVARFVDSSNTFTVDVPAPQSILKMVEKAKGGNVAKWGEVSGRRFVMAASRVPVDRVLTADGDRDEYEYDGTEPEQPQAFIVFGKEHKETASVALQQTLWSLLAAFVQLATTAYLNWMAYRPMQKLLSVMEGRGFITRRKPRTMREKLRDAADSARSNWSSFVRDPRGYMTSSGKALVAMLRRPSQVVPLGPDLNNLPDTTRGAVKSRLDLQVGSPHSPAIKPTTPGRLV